MLVADKFEGLSRLTAPTVFDGQSKPSIGVVSAAPYLAKAAASRVHQLSVSAETESEMNATMHRAVRPQSDR